MEVPNERVSEETYCELPCNTHSSTVLAFWISAAASQTYTTPLTPTNLATKPALASPCRWTAICQLILRCPRISTMRKERPQKEDGEWNKTMSCWRVKIRTYRGDKGGLCQRMRRGIWYPTILRLQRTHTFELSGNNFRHVQRATKPQAPG